MNRNLIIRCEEAAGTSALLVNGEVKSAGTPVVSITSGQPFMESSSTGGGSTSPGSHKVAGGGSQSSDVKQQLTYAQMAQKKKEAREAAEKAALAAQAAQTANVTIPANCVDHQTDDTKKIVKDSAVNKKLHGELMAVFQGLLGPG